MEGYILLHRKMIDWEWFDDAELVRFWLFFISKANWEDKKWHGITIPRGSFVSSLDHLSRDLRRSQQSIRTMCHKLKSTGELTSQSTNRFTTYTIVKYEEYQNFKEMLTSKSTSQRTYKQHSNNKQSTTTNTLNTLNTNNTSLLLERFEIFWLSYPRKVSKKDAQRVWLKLSPDDATFQLIIGALDFAKRSDQWVRDEGRFIPHPTTWLNQERWKDRTEVLKEVSWKDKFLTNMREKGEI